MKIRKRKNAIT